MKYYEDVVEIEKCFNDVESFVKLINDRHDAHYRRGEVLKHIDLFEHRGVVFDVCGNTLIKIDPEKHKYNLYVISVNIKPDSFCKRCGQKFSVNDIIKNRIHRRVSFKQAVKDDEIVTFFHKTCYQEELNETTAKEFNECFREIFPFHYEVETTENKYGSYEYNGPWFKVSFDGCFIIVGWRKRVIEIDYSNLTKNDLFSDRNDTHRGGIIHVNSFLEFIDTMRNLVNFKHTNNINKEFYEIKEVEMSPHMITYPAVLTKDEENSGQYNVYFPHFDNVKTSGRGVIGSFSKAVEALAKVVSEYYKNDITLPEPTFLLPYKKDYDYITHIPIDEELVSFYFDEE